MHPREVAGPDAAPVVARWGTGHPSAPLVVALHGHGTSEASMIELAPWLPHGPVAYVAVRGPLEEGSGFGWFTRCDDGGPDPASLATSTAWFLEWLDTEGDPERPVILLGFSGGATFAAGLMLGEPHRWAAGVLLHGTLPLHAGLPMTRGRLAGMPVFLADGTPDGSGDRTWEYLVAESGAPLRAEREPGGHQLAGRIVGEVGTWLGERLDWLRHHGENPVPDGEDQEWPTVPGGRLPERAAAAAGPGLATPYVQDTLYAVPDVEELAHLRPEIDGGLQLVLPDALAYDALAKGWAVAHPLAGVRLATGTVLIFAPRDTDEREIVDGIVAAAHAHALG